MHFVDVKSILSPHNGMNLYRGCTHGCIYCDARSLCYHTPIPFEDIEIKQNAPELLEDINKKAKCVVQITLTTYDEKLCKMIEPNVCTTRRRYEVLKELQSHGIPTIVWFTPVLPYVNDNEENLNGILGYCKDAGVRGIIKFDFGVTLREGDREYCYKAFDRMFPGLRHLYETKYGEAYNLVSPNNQELMKIFHKFCQENHLLVDDQCFEYMHEFPQKIIQGELLFS